MDTNFFSVYFKDKQKFFFSDMEKYMDINFDI